MMMLTMASCSHHRGLGFDGLQDRIWEGMVVVTMALHLFEDVAHRLFSFPRATLELPMDLSINLLWASVDLVLVSGTCFGAAFSVAELIKLVFSHSYSDTWCTTLVNLTCPALLWLNSLAMHAVASCQDALAMHAVASCQEARPCTLSLRAGCV